MTSTQYATTEREGSSLKVYHLCLQFHSASSLCEYLVCVDAWPGLCVCVCGWLVDLVFGVFPQLSLMFFTEIHSHTKEERERERVWRKRERESMEKERERVRGERERQRRFVIQKMPLLAES